MGAGSGLRFGNHSAGGHACQERREAEAVRAEVSSVKGGGSEAGKVQSPPLMSRTAWTVKMDTTSISKRFLVGEKMCVSVKLV